MPHNAEKDRIASALTASRCAEARLWGMKHRASENPPQAATGSFPYPARTCAEWTELPGGSFTAAEPTDEEREQDAVEGSARLLDALLRLAA